jgi:transcriptional regulator GlxA family with amidase domain
MLAHVYLRAAALFRELALARADGSLRHFLARLARIEVLVIDDWELIVEAVRIGKLRKRTRLHVALSDMVIAQLDKASPIPTSVTMPKDPRARALALTVVDNMTEHRSLPQLCLSVGTSVRTMQRLFRREVGSDFEFWRRQVRLMKAVELLVSGRTVKETSFAVGYRQPTAFVGMFRAILGATPKAWVQALGRAN